MKTEIDIFSEIISGNESRFLRNKHVRNNVFYKITWDDVESIIIKNNLKFKLSLADVEGIFYRHGYSFKPANIDGKTVRCFCKKIHVGTKSNLSEFLKYE